MHSLIPLLFIYIIVTNTFIIADKAHFNKEHIDFLRDLQEVGLKMSSFCSEAFEHAFNRAIPTKAFVLNENPEKAIADPPILLNLPSTIY